MNTKDRLDPATEIALLIELRGLTYEQAEQFVTAHSPQLPPSGTEIIPIVILDVEKLLEWAPKDADWVAAHVPGTSNVSIGVIVMPDPDRPAARFYHTTTSVDTLAECRGNLPELTEVFSLAELQVLAQAGGYPGRLAEYRRRNWSPQNELLTKLYEGRVAATTTQRVDILDTGGACLICNQPALQSAVATTISIGDHAQTIVLSLCPAHEEQSADKFLLDFLADKLGFASPLSINDATSEDIYRLIEETLVKLDCVDLRRDATKVQVTGTRNSGMKVILRCELHTGKRSYAYMVTTPSNVNVRRIDNAPDHPEQTIRWDHQHLGLPKDNKTVVPSCTFGLAALDEPKIRSEIELAELQMQMQSSRNLSAA